MFERESSRSSVAEPRRLEHRVAELAAQPVEHRGAAQEVELATADRLEELVPDVVDEKAIVAGEAGDRAVEVGRLGQREAGEVERRRPALAAADQGVELARGQLEPERGEQLSRFAGGHQQVPGAELGDFAVGAHAADRQRRLGAGREDELRTGREAGDDRRSPRRGRPARRSARSRRGPGRRAGGGRAATRPAVAARPPRSAARDWRARRPPPGRPARSARARRRPSRSARRGRCARRRGSGSGTGAVAPCPQLDQHRLAVARGRVEKDDGSG